MKPQTLHRQDVHLNARVFESIGLALGLLAGSAIVLMVVGIRL